MFPISHRVPVLSIPRATDLLLAVVSILLFLSACSMTPSNSELTEALSNGDPLIGKVYVIKNLKRINGYEGTAGRYILEFSCDILIIESPGDYFDQLAKSPPESGNAIAKIAVLGLAIGAVAKWGLLTSAVLVSKQKGDVIPFHGRIEMMKSERGWIATPIQ